MSPSTAPGPGNRRRTSPFVLAVGVCIVALAAAMAVRALWQRSHRVELCLGWALYEEPPGRTPGVDAHRAVHVLGRIASGEGEEAERARAALETCIIESPDSSIAQIAATVLIELGSEEAGRLVVVRLDEEFAEGDEHAASLLLSVVRKKGLMLARGTLETWGDSGSGLSEKLKKEIEETLASLSGTEARQASQGEAAGNPGD